MSIVVLGRIHIYWLADSIEREGERLGDVGNLHRVQGRPHKRDRDTISAYLSLFVQPFIFIQIIIIFSHRLRHRRRSSRRCPWCCQR